ncbi:MAG: lipoate--protein ligase [Clostridia bacterium]|nr:lipoate--protein ligase [Clostridia bacterium]
MENFQFVISSSNDPYFNLASEEYLLKQKKGYYIYLWINSPSVIIGSNQNTLLEVNLKNAESKGVKVVRRITGGGAVYHDYNNVCYSIIAPFDASENNYVKFTAPVISFLNSLGVKAEFSGRNDITVSGKKISGNAQVIYKDRLLHHGTLLFNSDLDALKEVLVENKLKMESKGVKSIRARVTNILEHLPNPISCNKFFNLLVEHFKKDLPVYSFTKEDIININSLIENKYSTYEWNIGYSPKGKVRFDGRFNFGTLTLTFNLVDGIISDAEVFGDYFSTKNLQELINNLNGKKFIKNEVENALSGIELYIKDASAKEIVEKLFS